MAEGGRFRGGICGLLDLIEEHRAALEYDFRTRFQGLPDGIYSVPERMGWGEALRMVRILRSDPGSMLAAAIEGWDYPFPREVAVTADLYDLEFAKTGAKNRQPYPRPYATDVREKKRRGNAAGRSRAQVVEILRAHGHTLS